MAPRLPRAEISAISEMYVGTRTQAAPTPIPTITRATYRIQTDVAKIIISQDIRNGTASRRRTFLRPYLSDMAPDGRAPITAPIAHREPIHDPSSDVMGRKESSLISFGSTGDVHAKAVPTPTARIDAENQN